MLGLNNAMLLNPHEVVTLHNSSIAFNGTKHHMSIIILYFQNSSFMGTSNYELSKYLERNLSLRKETIM